MTKFRERLSIDYFKREILKTTYGTKRSIIARLDPRTLFLWYLALAIVPWFLYDRVVLLALVGVVTVGAWLTRVSGLLIFFLAVGMIGETINLLVAILLFGGTLDAFWSISPLVLKLLIVSLASIAAFAGLDPERLSDGLLALGIPRQFAFGVSYGFRIIPVLIDEYQAVFNAYRLRSVFPNKTGLLVLCTLPYWFRLILRSFYPMMFNTAKRTRTTIEALELRGFTWSVEHPETRTVRLAHLGFTRLDSLWLLLNGTAIAGAFVLGWLIP